MISYYELLGMIKEDKAPKEIRVHLTNTPRIYEAVYDVGDFNYYWLSKNSVEDGDYKCYLAECFLESGMFEKNIEILEEETNVSEEQVLFNNLTSIDQDYVIRIMKMLQQPIDYLKSKGDE